MLSLLKWYPELPSKSFTTAWQKRLAYKIEIVVLKTGKKIIDQGKVLGISDEGSLILSSNSGVERRYSTGEIQLRLVDRS